MLYISHYFDLLYEALLSLVLTISSLFRKRLHCVTLAVL